MLNMYQSFIIKSIFDYIQNISRTCCPLEFNVCETVSPNYIQFVSLLQISVEWSWILLYMSVIEMFIDYLCPIDFCVKQQLGETHKV